MTREEILREYEVDANGIIRSLGKFEAEMLYAPYFYQVMLDGGTEQVSGADFVVLDSTDRAQFPELGTAYGIALEESEQGFVHITVFDTQTAYDSATTDLDELASEVQADEDSNECES